MSSSKTDSSTVTLPEAPFQPSSPSFEKLWRGSGISFVLFFVIAYIVEGMQPKVGASAGDLVSFYGGHRTRILIATIILGLAVLNLMWFAAAIRSVLHDAGQGGWGSAATASSAAVGAVLLVIVTVIAALAYSIVGPGNLAITSALNDFTWACLVVSSFPRAMLVMSSAFGLWRAKMISDGLFAAGVAVVVLGVLGGTTWASDGFWAPDGAYSQFIWPILGLVWILVVSAVVARVPATRGEW